MRIILYNILFVTGRLFSFFFSPNFNRKLCLLRSVVYTGWLSSQFKRIGTGCRLAGEITLVNGKHIVIGNKTVNGRRVILSAWHTYRDEHFQPSIIIGDNCNIGEGSHITAIDKVYVGNGVLTGKMITITDNSHGLFDPEDLSIAPITRRLRSKGPVIIEDNVWIGDKVVILPNVKIGKGAIIGANSVIVHDIPPYSTAVGVPGKVVKQLNK